MDPMFGELVLAAFAGLVVGLWVSTYYLKRLVKHGDERQGVFYKRVYLSAAFSVATVVMILAYLTPTQN